MKKIVLLLGLSALLMGLAGCTAMNQYMQNDPQRKCLRTVSGISEQACVSCHNGNNQGGYSYFDLSINSGPGWYGGGWGCRPIAPSNDPNWAWHQSHGW